MLKLRGSIVALMVFTIVLLGASAPQLEAQKGTPVDEKLTRLLIIFDGSRSMHARWEREQKINIAKRLLEGIMDSLQSHPSSQLELALRVYGHQSPVPPQDCEDSRLEIPFARGNFPALKDYIRALTPKGTTPLAYSLEQAANDFPDCSNCRNVIMLITDGIEACEGDPCQVAINLQKKGITLRPFVLGLGIDDSLSASLNCIGKYYNVEDPNKLSQTLKIVIRSILDPTTVQVNLLDHEYQPRETNVALTFSNALSGEVEQQIIHTMNFRGRPDTLYLDPLIDYDLKVHSVPEKSKKDIELTSGKHNIIGLDLPRGFLEFQSSGLSKYGQLQAVVLDQDSARIINVQKAEEKHKYLAGLYRLKILTTPPILVDQVKVRGGHSTSVTIPPPGQVNLVSDVPGYGSIVQRVPHREKPQWVIDLNPRKPRQSVTLQPGKYTVIFRPRTAGSSRFSVSKNFNIQAGRNTRVNLN